MDVRSVLVAGISLGMLAGVLCAALLQEHSLAGSSALLSIAGVSLLVLTVVGGLIILLSINNDGSPMIVAFVLSAIVMFITTGGSYAAWFGQPIEATVTEVLWCSNDNDPLRIQGSTCVYGARLAESGTGRELGWTSCTDRLREGANVTALVDPRGWFTVQTESCALRGWAGITFPVALLIFL